MKDASESAAVSHNVRQRVIETGAAENAGVEQETRHQIALAAAFSTPAFYAPPRNSREAIQGDRTYIERHGPSFRFALPINSARFGTSCTPLTFRRRPQDRDVTFIYSSRPSVSSPPHSMLSRLIVCPVHYRVA